MAEQVIYNRIKIELSKKRLNNKWLAAKLGVTQGTISKWVTNKGQPTIIQLYQVAAVLDVAVYDLLEPQPIKVTIEK